MLLVQTYILCCCKCLLLLVTLYRQDTGCDQQDRPSSPRWALCLPLPAASCGVTADAGLGCNGDHSHGISCPLHHPEQTPGTFISALRMGTIRLVHGNLGTGVGGWGSVSSWESAATESKPLRGHFHSECQTCHLLPQLLWCLPTRSRAAYSLPVLPTASPPGRGSHSPPSQSGGEGWQTSHHCVKQAPSTPSQHPAPPPPCLLTHPQMLL